MNLFVEEPFSPGEIRVGGLAAHHAHVRRLERGDAIRLLDGRGRIGHGNVSSFARSEVVVLVDRIEQVAAPAPLEVLIPVADRDRMLLAAEKCAEMQVTAWRPVYFARSRSVSPRGEGDKFRDRVQARMQSALEQSGGAWLPQLHVQAELEAALKSVSSDWRRLVLDAHGTPLLDALGSGGVAIAVGPEGGMEPRELETARSLDWTIASLGGMTLRFETAIIAAAAVARAAQLSAWRS